MTTIAALFGLASFCALAPTASASSTLLSGYGGPGEGNQAILGSTLIGGSGGSGGGGAGATGAGASAPQAVSIEVPAAPHATSRTGGGAVSESGSPRGHARHRQAAGTSFSALAPEPAKTVEVRAAGAPALGLSGTDVAYVVLALAVLMLTAFATVRLTRSGRPTEGGRGETDSG